MQFECSSCNKPLSLPDEKVPIGKQFNFSCPYCHHKNVGFVDPKDAVSSSPKGNKTSEQVQARPQVNNDDEGVTPPKPGKKHKSDVTYPETFPVSELDNVVIPGLVTAGNNTPAAAPLTGFIDDSDAKAGLIIYDDDEVANLLSGKLKDMGYQPSIAMNVREAVKQIKFSEFQVVLIQETYYGATLTSNQALRAIQTIDASTRRKMMVALISPTLVTLDDLVAFSLSLNAVINENDLEVIDRILWSSIGRSQKFYAVYKEILANHGHY